MNFLRTSIKNNKNILYFLSLIFVIGFILGIIFYLKQESIMKESISASLNLFKENIGNINNTNIFYHLIIIVLIFFLSMIIIGIPISLFYLFYEGISFGFLISIFLSNYGFQGFIFSLIFYIITKLIYILIIIYLNVLAIKTGKKVINCLLKKSNDSLYYFFKRNFLRIIIILVFVIINDLIIYFLGLKILKLFLFLL